MNPARPSRNQHAGNHETRENNEKMLNSKFLGRAPSCKDAKATIKNKIIEDISTQGTKPDDPAAGHYRSLVAKVDAHSRLVVDALGAHMQCGPGCAGCCSHISVFTVEAVALARGVARLAPTQRQAIRRRAAGCGPADACPLLVDDHCTLYAVRPIICRTHGLPLLIASGDGGRMDWCPLNFEGLDAIPREYLLDLEQLNRMLAGVNQAFLACCEHGTPTRIPLAQALLMELA